MLTGSNVSKLSATRSRPIVFHLLFAASIVAQLVLIWAFRFHPCMDVPNHLASLKILSALRSGDPFFSADFTYSIRLVPYAGFTLLWLCFPDGFDLHLFEKLVLSLYVVSLPIAHYWLLRTFCPRNLELSLLASMATINLTYDLGNLNYLLCLPVVLVACVVFHKSWSSWQGLAAFIVVAAIAYACHVYGLVSLIVFSFCLVSSTTLRGLLTRGTDARRPRGFGPGIARWSLACGWLIALLVIAYLRVYPERGDPTYGVSFRELFRYINSLFRFRGGWRLLLPILCATLLVSPIVDLRRRGLRKSGEAIVWPLALPGVVLLFMYLFGPETVGDRTSVSARFLYPSFLFLSCSWRLIEQPGYRRFLLMVLAVVFVVKWTGDFKVHSWFNREALAVESGVIERLPTNARVLTTHLIPKDKDGRMAPFFFFYNYAVVDKNAYMPKLFSKSFHAVRYKTAPNPPHHRQLTRDDLSDYEYVWVFSDVPEKVTGEIMHQLTPIGRSKVHHLYRIKRTSDLKEAGESP